MYYNVFSVEFIGSINHIFIFVETEANGCGRKFHVTGNILTGMIYENGFVTSPEQSELYVPDSKRLIGQIEDSSLPRLEAICNYITPPGAQVGLNGKRKDPSKPLRRCGDWVREVIEALITQNVLIQEERRDQTLPIQTFNCTSADVKSAAVNFSWKDQVRPG